VSAIFSLFTQGVSLGFSAAVSPGPFQAFLLSRAARVGVRRALPLALAPLVSDGPVVATVLLVLSAAPPALLRGLAIGGGVLLLVLALGAWRTAGETGPAGPAAGDDARGSFLRAALVNAAGPGPWIFWSTICGPILVQAWRAAPVRGVAFLAGFYLVLVGGNAALVAAFGMAGRIGPRAARGLSRASAALMAAMGALQLWRGLSGR
jgi:threonine/homoserine/homoserine lactone efflux protein